MSYAVIKSKTGWWFQICLFSPLPGEMVQFDEYFSDGLKPPTRKTVSVQRCKQDDELFQVLAGASLLCALRKLLGYSNLKAATSF